MNQLHSFVTFNIQETISCMQFLQDGTVFVATDSQIILYDLSTVTTISKCPHSNSNKMSQMNQSEKEDQLSPVQIHYFSQNTQQDQQSLQPKSGLIKLGYLAVHYKLIGISIYQVKKKKVLTGQLMEFKFYGKNQQAQYHISFERFVPVKFGAAFLRVCFGNSFYKQAIQSSQLHKQRISTVTSANQTAMQKQIHNLHSFTNFNLENKQKTGQIYVFSNQDEIFCVKKINLNNKQNSIQQTYQLDEQSAKLNSLTVTAMKYYQLAYQAVYLKIQRYLIMAVQGGILYFYQLPNLQHNSKLKMLNKQYYLQPHKVIDLKKFVEFQPQEQDADFSVLSIQLLHDALALVTVRKCGILLVNLRDFVVITQIKIKKHNKKPLFLSNIRHIHPITLRISSNITLKTNQNLPINQSQEQNKSNIQLITNTQKISFTSVISTLNKIKRLSLQIQVKKSLGIDSVGTSTFQNSISVTKSTVNYIQQLNTQMIEGFVVVEAQNHKQSNQNHAGPQTQIYGHFKQGKIFYFIP